MSEGHTPTVAMPGWLLKCSHRLCPADLFTGWQYSTASCFERHSCMGVPRLRSVSALQARQKLPRWQPRSRRGVFMGFSQLHSSENLLVLNLDTGSVTPQYHVVFHDQFSKTPGQDADMPTFQQCMVQKQVSTSKQCNLRFTHWLDSIPGSQSRDQRINQS